MRRDPKSRTTEKLTFLSFLPLFFYRYFLEPSDGIRSFDRTFILAPAPEGSAWVLITRNSQSNSRH